MKCPLLVMGQLAQQIPAVGSNSDCLKEECAWWDEIEGGRCAILSLIGRLDDIAVKLMHIDQNMGVQE